MGCRGILFYIISGEHELGRVNKDDGVEFGQETQLQYDVLELFDNGDVRPLPPSPRSPPAPLSLQRVVQDDVSSGGNAPVGALYRGQGQRLGVRAINLLSLVMLLLLLVVDVLMVVVLY